VLFFARGATDKGNTKAVWFFDMRANMPAFGKHTPFTHEHFVDFMKAFGEDPNGKAKRRDQGEEGRFRKYTREAIKERDDNLDVAWLKDDSHTDAASTTQCAGAGVVDFSRTVLAKAFSGELVISSNA